LVTGICLLIKHRCVTHFIGIPTGIIFLHSRKDAKEQRR